MKTEQNKTKIVWRISMAACICLCIAEIALAFQCFGGEVSTESFDTFIRTSSSLFLALMAAEIVSGVIIYITAKKENPSLLDILSPIFRLIFAYLLLSLVGGTINQMGFPDLGMPCQVVSTLGLMPMYTCIKFAAGTPVVGGSYQATYVKHREKPADKDFDDKDKTSHPKLTPPSQSLKVSIPVPVVDSQSVLVSPPEHPKAPKCFSGEGKEQ